MARFPLPAVKPWNASKKAHALARIGVIAAVAALVVVAVGSSTAAAGSSSRNYRNYGLKVTGLPETCSIVPWQCNTNPHIQVSASVKSRFTFHGMGGADTVVGLNDEVFPYVIFKAKSSTASDWTTCYVACVIPAATSILVSIDPNDLSNNEIAWALTNGWNLPTTGIIWVVW